MPEPIVINLYGDYDGTSPFFFVAPADWNNLDNKIECFGHGGRGYHNGGGGGAGGAYARKVNVSLVPGNVYRYQLRSSPFQATTDTWFKDALTVMAKAGPDATSATGAVAPPASASVGDVCHKGGDGGDGGGLDGSGNPRGGGGGGSGATEDADGYDGGNADPSSYAGGGGAGTGEDGKDGSGLTGGDGGKAADGTLGGAGTTTSDAGDGVGPGSGGGAPGSNGKDGGDGGGRDTTATGIVEGGGGGSSGKAGSPFGGLGGNAGEFNGAGAGSSYPVADAFSGLGSRGWIRITYTPAVVPPNPGEGVVSALERAENVEAFHLVEIDAALVGTPGAEVTPTLTYAYGIGSAPLGAISLEGFATVDRRTFIYSDKGWRAPVGDPDGAKVSLPRLVTSPSIQRVLNLSLDQAAAGFSWGNGTLARVDSDYYFEGLDNGAINYNSTDGAPVRVYLGLKPYDAARGIYTDPEMNDLLPIFTGVAQQWRISRDTIQVPLRDVMYLLDAPLQRLVYSGAGGLGGDAAIAGLPLPKTRGGTAVYPVRNVKPVLVDATHLIYQYTDGPGTVEALYEGAAAGFTYQGDVADLYSGTTDAGKYRTDNARGLFQLGTNATADITCDVTGEFPRGGAVTVPAEIARRLITEDMNIAAGHLDLGAFSLAEAQYDYVSGAYFAPDENWSGLSAVALMLRSIGAKIATSRAGKLRPYVVRGYAAPADAVYTARDIQDIRDQAIPEGLSPVVSRIRVRFGRNWTVQSGGYLGSATASRKQFVASAGPVASWADGTNLIKYPSAKDPDVIETALLVEADAQAVADALGGFWGIPRRAFEIDLPLYAIGRDIADNIRFDEDLGIRPYPFYCYVYGLSYTPGSSFCTLSVVA